MATTADQNVAFLLSDPVRKEKAVKALAEAGFAGDTPEEEVLFRICPGNHECRMGLCATRDVAREVIAAMGNEARTRSWAISGCANSCAQPQLSKYGILAVKSLKGEDGVRRPLFDLYRRDGEGFGKAVRQGLSLEDLLQAVADLG
jgi:sulfite reductase beta subunit-like hemoprotein